jgi:hypothetical protein
LANSAAQVHEPFASAAPWPLHVIASLNSQVAPAWPALQAQVPVAPQLPPPWQVVAARQYVHDG